MRETVPAAGTVACHPTGIRATPVFAHPGLAVATAGEPPGVPAEPLQDFFEDQERQRGFLPCPAAPAHGAGIFIGKGILVRRWSAGATTAMILLKPGLIHDVFPLVAESLEQGRSHG